MRDLWQIIEILRGQSSRFVSASELARDLCLSDSAVHPNPWRSIMAEILGAWRTETDDAPAAVAEWLDFLFQALGQRRRDERMGHGVVLSTVHSAKGMEYSHVLLCGDWAVAGDLSKIEEERRTFYVGMTRARETLTIMDRADRRSVLIADLVGPCFAARRYAGVGSASAAEERDYQVLGLDDLFMDFLGWRRADDPAHAAMAALQPGASLGVRVAGERIQLTTVEGLAAAQLSTKATEVWRDRLASVEGVRLLGAFTRLRGDVTDPQFAPRIQSDRWKSPSAR